MRSKYPTGIIRIQIDADLTKWISSTKFFRIVIVIILVYFIDLYLQNFIVFTSNILAHLALFTTHLISSTLRGQ